MATSIQARDASFRSLSEIFLLDSGVSAIFAHRKAHALYQAGKTWRAQYLMARTKKKTGIEIHPAATIGRDVFIDHGNGVVIGETAVVGDRVTLLHGVTLGSDGRSHKKGEARHPIVEHDVYIGAHAQIVGRVRIGHHAKIGAGAVVITDVPPYATAVGVPARIVRKEK